MSAKVFNPLGSSKRAAPPCALTRRSPMAQERRRYTREFKLDALKRVAEGRPE